MMVETEHERGHGQAREAVLNLLKAGPVSGPWIKSETVSSTESCSILLVNEKGHISYANRAAEQMFLASMGELCGRKFGLPLHEGSSEIDVHCMENGYTKALMQCNLIQHKRRLEYLVTIQFLKPGQKAPPEPDARGELLNKLFTHSPLGIITVNLSGQVTVWNKTATKILGWSAQSIVGQELPENLEAQESLRDVWQKTLYGQAFNAYELPNQKRDDGRLVDLQVWSVLMHNNKGMPCGTLLMLTDVTAHRRVKAHLRHVVEHDALTGLPNRHQFRKQLHRTLGSLKKKKENHLIIFAIGIDRFKSINKSLGRVEGDFLLQRVVQRLKSVLYETDLVARGSGDEFLVLLRDTRHVCDSSRISEKLIQSVRKPFSLNGREIFLSVSIGIAAFPNDGNTAKALLHAADSAMDRSKELGGNCCQYYSKVLDEQTLHQIFLEQELHHALDRGQLYLDYQPQWSLISGELVGVEALLRWQHPQLGQVSPAAFIPIADHSGLILPIGAMVLREACQQLQRWDAQLGKKLRMSVNVSARQFEAITLERDVFDALEDSGINPQRLELEITESVLARDLSEVANTLHSLKNIGVRISIDDFGTGYSSLSYLADLPVDTLKIDQSFVRGIETKPGCKAIISSILTLVRGLKLRVIAEGIETDTQLAYLRALGCDEGQGYLMGRPMSAETLVQLTTTSSSLN